jgi:diaminohydroxyphosphoribosylaminopyrimidine deaminase/5-amino-6-(5-phosphoribosylamino)uracil reductase
VVLPHAERCGEKHHRLRRVLERRRGYAVDALDATYLERAVELASRAIADTAPNPPVGAVIVRDGRTLGEGWHHRRGEPHAEAEALRVAREAGEDVRAATMYVTLEPHDHESTMPPCSLAIVAAGIARVVVGTLDPNELTHGRGVARMRSAGIAVDVAEDPASRELIERFAYTIGSRFPFVTLKMAMSLDGYVAPYPGTHRVTGEAARERVNDLRAEHDAVMVGAGTVRIDDPLLTIRPHRTRVKPYARVVACEAAPVPRASKVLAPPADAPAGSYRPTIVLAPAGLRAEFAPLGEACEVVYAGAPDARELDLPAALIALRVTGITTVLCEGGPTLAGRLIAARLVERIVWFVAPSLLHAAGAVPVLAGTDLSGLAAGWTFEEVERVGNDLMISARLPHV